MNSMQESLREYMTDSIDIEERLSESVSQLYPHYQPPEDDLFAFDGLGHEPRMPKVLGDR